MIALDTNVLVRFFVGDDVQQHKQAVSLIGKLSQKSPGFVSSIVLIELFWVLSRTYGYTRQECLEALWALASSEQIEFDDGESVVASLHEAEKGADFADALIGASAHLFQASKVVTFDKKAAAMLGWTLL